MAAIAITLPASLPALHPHHSHQHPTCTPVTQSILRSFLPILLNSMPSRTSTTTTTTTTTPRVSVKKLMSEAVRRRSSPTSAVSPKPLKERDLNVPTTTTPVASVTTGGKSRKDKEEETRQVVELLEKLRLGGGSPSTTTSTPVSLKTVVKKKPVPPLVVFASKPRPSSVAVVVHPHLNRPPSKYDATLPKKPSPLFHSFIPSSPSTPSSLTRTTPPPPVHHYSQHHGYSRSALSIVRGIWEDRYESWLFNRLQLSFPTSSTTTATTTSCNIRPISSPSPSSTSQPTKLNPAIFPRAGNLSPPSSPSTSPSEANIKVDWHLGFCSLSTVQRTMYLFDLEQRLHSSPASSPLSKQEQQPQWEINWDIRWQVVAVLLGKSREIATVGGGW